MAVVQKTKKAFRGNIRRSINKVIDSQTSLQNWMNAHPDWPVKLLDDPQRAQLQAIAIILDQQLSATYPVGP